MWVNGGSESSSDAQTDSQTQHTRPTHSPSPDRTHDTLVRRLSFLGTKTMWVIKEKTTSHSTGKDRYDSFETFTFASSLLASPLVTQLAGLQFAASEAASSHPLTLSPLTRAASPGSA